MAVQNQACMRCGLCCKRQLCRVPKNERSDLSPDYLDHVRATSGTAAVKAYIRENTVWQGKRCPWLTDRSDGTTACTAYARRPRVCREYNADGSCRIWIQAFGLIEHFSASAF